MRIVFIPKINVIRVISKLLSYSEFKYDVSVLYKTVFPIIYDILLREIKQYTTIDVKNIMLQIDFHVFVVNFILL